MEVKIQQELPPPPISPALSPKEAPPVLEEQPPVQASTEPEDSEDTSLFHLAKKQEMAAIRGETDEEEVEKVGERIFQEPDKFVLHVEDVQALKVNKRESHLLKDQEEDRKEAQTKIRLKHLRSEQSRKRKGNKRGRKPANRQVSGQPQQENGVKMSPQGEGAGQPLTSSVAAAQEQVASTEPLKRGRGRPRKQLQQPTGKPSPKRPRGRPKGSTNKSPSQAAQKVFYNVRSRKRKGNKRGRKPANRQVSGQPQQENGVKMSPQGEGAGQPLTSSVAAAQEQVVSTEPLKRGRGRPRKQLQEVTGEPSPKRPRGRPKGSKNKNPSQASQKEPTGEPSPKRSRGRPKGSKNKNPSKAVQKDIWSSSCDGSAASAAVAGGWGGQRGIHKNAFESSGFFKVPYKKRGNHQDNRHEGNKRGKRLVSRQVSKQPQLANRVTVRTQVERASQPSTSSAAAAQEQPSSTEPPKRGRGRPRKRPQEPMEEPSPKRPRGRPRGSTKKSPSQAAQKVPYSRRASGQEWSKRGKKLVSGREKVQSQQANGVLMSTQSEGADQPSTSSAAAAQEQPASTEPLKRGRGRPRKQPQPTGDPQEGRRGVAAGKALPPLGWREGNEHKKENFVEASMVSSETAKIIVEKEELEIKGN
ncbi:hypothetical protein JD844_033893 [Phrynosoma platyrhinos]|uniref:Uncharacterized protein n=1 Tax=Phrynosoma platyrhinos TaxID=52577 RepID=A0ABQ7T7J7_PHRPL|nr:hypothetical protein JD844_033893 [Phrynosoma platyrhinos]